MLLTALAALLALQSAPPAPASAPGAAPGAAPAAAPQAGQQVTASSKLRVEPPVQDFGRVAPGSRNPCRFVLRNVSQAPLKILEARPSCKCTTVTNLANKVLQPGETVEVDVTLDAPSVPGTKDAKIFIAVEGFNDVVLAQLKGLVVMPIEATPPFCETRPSAGGGLRGTVNVKSIDGKPFRILSCDGMAPVINGFDPAKDPPRSSYDVAFDFTGVPGPQMRQWWMIETDRPGCPLVPVSIRHDLTGAKFDMGRYQRFWVNPETLVSAGTLAPGEPFETSVEFGYYDPDPSHKGRVVRPDWNQVKGVRSLSPMATAELISSEMRGDKMTVKLRFTPTAAAKDKSIYVPVEVTTASGAGNYYFAASVRGAPREAASQSGGSATPPATK